MKLKLIASAILIGGTLAVCALMLGSVTLHEPVAGDIEASTAAFVAGIRPGDRILSVNGKSPSTWEEVILGLAANKGRAVEVAVSRAEGESVISLQVPASGKVDGLTNEYRLPVIGLKSGSPLQRYGIEIGDEIIEIEGHPVVAWRDLDALLLKQDSTKPLNMQIRRGTKTVSLAVAPTGHEYSLKGLGIEDAAWFVGRVSSGSLGSHLGVKSMDRLLMVQGQPVTLRFGAQRLAQALKTEKKLEVDVIRGQEVRHLETMRPQTEAKVGDGLEQVFHFLGLTDLTRKAKSAQTKKRDPLLWLRYTAHRKTAND